MGIFKKVIDETITLEEGAIMMGYSSVEFRENLIDYLKAQNKKLPNFLTDKKQIAITKEKISNEYIPSFEVVEGENLKAEERTLPDLSSMYKYQFFRTLDLQDRLEQTDNIEWYLQTFRIMQKYLDQMAEFDLQQKYSHKEQFDMVFKFMLSKKPEHPELIKEFIALLGSFNA